MFALYAVVMEPELADAPLRWKRLAAPGYRIQIQQRPTMKLVEIRGEREVLGKNAAMRLILQKSPFDARIGHTQTAPKLALQLSTPGRHGLFLLKRRKV